MWPGKSFVSHWRWAGRKSWCDVIYLKVARAMGEGKYGTVCVLKLYKELWVHMPFLPDLFNVKTLWKGEGFTYCHFFKYSCDLYIITSMYPRKTQVIATEEVMASIWLLLKFPGLFPPYLPVRNPS